MRASGFCVEETYRVTDTLVNIYSDFSLALHHERSEQLMEDSTNLSKSSVYLLVSCHHRLLDIWSKIFGHARQCVASAITGIGGRHGYHPSVPKLGVGAFSPSPSNNLYLHEALVSQFALQLRDGIQKVVVQLTATSAVMSQVEEFTGGVPSELPSSPNPDAERIAQALKSARQEVLNRAEKSLQLFEEIRQMTRELPGEKV